MPLDELKATLTRNALRYHCGQALTCSCGVILDCRRAVETDVIGPLGTLVRTLIRCATCHDNHVAPGITAIKAKHPDFAIEVHDGRELFAQAPAAPRAPRVKTTPRVIELGKSYEIYHTSGFIKATPLYTQRASSGRTHWICKNERTGRTIEVKSAAKFRQEVAA